MRDYELVFIISPELEEEATTELTDKIKSWITEEGGEIEEVEEWGRKKFSYLIRNHKEGQYFLLRAQIPPTFIATLERNLRLQEPVLRYLITVQED
jgi:small subunit ribosomal protein S6